MFTTTDTTTKLVKLGESESFSVLYTYNCCIGIIDPYFYY